MATVRREKNGDLTPQEKKEIQAVIDHACTWKEKLENLSEDFDKKGSFGLMWDSKVPDEDKWFFYFFTFRSSDKDDVKAKIEKYVEFYREMSEIANQMMNNSKETSQRDKDACQLVKELRAHLVKLSSAAETGEKTTDSSTVYRLHREFIDKHEKLKHLVKNVECVAWKQSREMVMEQSQKKITKLEADLKKSTKRFENLCDKFEDLMTKYGDVTEEKSDLEKANIKMEEQNRQLLEKSTDQKEQLEAQKKEKEALEKEKAEMAQRNQRLEDRHEDVCEKFNQLFARHQEVRMDNGVMRGENSLLQERSLDQAEQIETLRRENRELEQEKGNLSQAISELSAQQRDLNALVLSLLDRVAVRGPVP